MKTLIQKSFILIIALLFLFSCDDESIVGNGIFAPNVNFNGQWIQHSYGYYVDRITSITTSDNGITIDKLFFLGNYTKDGFVGYTTYHAETVKDSITLQLVNDTIHVSTINCIER